MALTSPQAIARREELREQIMPLYNAKMQAQDEYLHARAAWENDVHRLLAEKGSDYDYRHDQGNNVLAARVDDLKIISDQKERAFRSYYDEFLALRDYWEPHGNIGDIDAWHNGETWFPDREWLDAHQDEMEARKKRYERTYLGVDDEPEDDELEVDCYFDEHTSDTQLNDMWENDVIDDESYWAEKQRRAQEHMRQSGGSGRIRPLSEVGTDDYIETSECDDLGVDDGYQY